MSEKRPMTMSELWDACRSAGEAIAAYRAKWTGWREEARSQLRAYLSASGSAKKRLEKIAEALKEHEGTLREIDKLLDLMQDPPILPLENIIAEEPAVAASIESDLFGVPPELRLLAPALRRVTYPRCGPGVYFLVKGATVVYVGKSVQPLSRIGQHSAGVHGNPEKPWERAFILHVEEGRLGQVEEAFIRVLAPAYNVNASGEPSEADRRTVDAEIGRASGRAA